MVAGKALPKLQKIAKNMKFMKTAKFIVICKTRQNVQS